MAGEWRNHKVSEFADVVGGGTPRTNVAANFGGGIPWITPKDLSRSHGRFIDGGERSLTQEGLSASGARLLPKGAVLVSSRAPIGLTAIAAVPLSTNQGFRSLVVKPPHNALFIYYLISSSVDYLERVSVGSTFKELPGGVFRELIFDLPHPDTQRSIANLLGSLDDKIELNRQMAATLEDMARALFNSWFVDFDPVHAKAEGRDTGLPADIASLFPNNFDDEGLPSGWKSGSLDDFADTNSESWKASAHPDVIEYVDLSNCKWGKIEGVSTYSWDEAPSRARRVARTGDTIFGTVRPGNGSYAYVGRDGLTVSTGFAVLRPKAKQYREIVYFAATAIDNIRWLEQLAAGHGGAYPAVNPDKVSATTVIVPGDRVAKAFAAATAGMIGRIETLKQESAELEQMRDALLPKLLSGELRVADAESVIAAA
ncbi:restriction endonuclease subunit S [uncultured Sphingomonas sp.]|uniref:restriction endonuclease subunit S n=1 Tax=uncultured Sphingomonas sp. TaxID=158754 RepID=UPI00258472EE|nr:restriction endonuclease subunit S [uncultured Sphingomonas sp.]